LKASYCALLSQSLSSGFQHCTGRAFLAQDSQDVE
jgi:hypothetical protein